MVILVNLRVMRIANNQLKIKLYLLLQRNVCNVLPVDIIVFTKNDYNKMGDHVPMLGAGYELQLQKLFSGYYRYITLTYWF